jgi:spermidine synthase
VYSGEDGSGTSVLRTVPGRDTRVVVFANGVGQSWIPYGGIHTVLGALPAFIHPDPKTAVVIGLGSGDTVYAVAGRPGLARLTCVEIIAPQLATLRRFSTHTPYPPILTLLSDPRIEHVAGDGRAYVMRSRQQFDLIEADALRPASAYSGNLYSAGYFRLLDSQLAPGGLAVTWGPTPRVHDTFASVFPYVISFGDILVGSRTPIPFDADAIRARVRQPAVLDHFWRAGVDIDALLAPYLVNARPIPAAREPLGDLNEDLFPRDEFTLPRIR